MRKILEKFKKNGLNHRMPRKGNRSAIYETSQKGEGIGYEVHKVLLKPRRIGKIKNPDNTHRTFTLPKREVLANNNEFGTHAWTYQALSNAQKKYEQLNHKGENSWK